MGQKKKTIHDSEIENYQKLFTSFKSKVMNDQDLLNTSEDFEFLPKEVLEPQKAIEQQNLFKFVDELDVESMAYKYINALNQFRYEFTVSNIFKLIKFPDIELFLLCSLKSKFWKLCINPKPY